MKKYSILIKTFIFCAAFFCCFNVKAEPSCLVCGDEETYRWEQQFVNRIHALKDIYGNKIDEVALFATVMHKEPTLKAIESRYEKDFNRSSYKNSVDAAFNKTDDNRKITANPGLTDQNQINLLNFAAMIMADSSGGGSYSDDKFKEYLINGSVDGEYTKNLCTIYNVVDSFRSFIFSLFTGGASAEDFSKQGNTNDNVYSIDKVCKYGYIGGVYNLYDSSDPDKEISKASKARIATEIIELIKYYRSIVCQNGGYDLVATTTSGDFANWKQCDSAWGGISLGGSDSACSIGCLVTSVAIQIARSGTKVTNLPSGYSAFNPGAFYVTLNNNGGFISGGNFTWSGHQSIAGNWKFGNSVTVNTGSTKKLAEMLSNEFSSGAEGKYQKFAVLQFHSPETTQHWVAVDTVTKDSVTIFDPWKTGTTLDESFPGWVVDTYRVMYATDVLQGQTGKNLTTSSATAQGKSNEVTAADPNDFVQHISKEWQHGSLPKDKVKYIMLHDTEAGKDSAEEIANDWEGNGIAAHFIVSKDGTITQTVPIDKIAHHAGWAPSGSNDAFGVTQERDDKKGSDTNGQDYAMNAWSIGIEIIHEHDGSEYPEAQLKAVDSLIAYIDSYLGSKPTITDHKEWTGNQSTSKVGKQGQGKQDVDDSFPLDSYKSSRNHGSSSGETTTTLDENGCPVQGQETTQSGNILEKMSEWFTSLEGGQTCNYKGQGEDSGYAVIYDPNDAGGLTAANGVTKGTASGWASEVGYTSFESDFVVGGCLDKAKMHEIQLRVLQYMDDDVMRMAEERGVTLNDNERMSLIRNRYGGAIYTPIILDTMKQYGNDSWEVFHCMVTVGCGFKYQPIYHDGWANGGAAAYEVYKTGNLYAANLGKGYAYYQSIDNMSKLQAYMDEYWPSA